jgi:hypothetical protein
LTMWRHKNKYEECYSMRKLDRSKQIDPGSLNQLCKFFFQLCNFFPHAVIHDHTVARSEISWRWTFILEVAK